MNSTVFLIIITVCSSIALLVLQAGGTGDGQADDLDFVWSLGPLKMAVGFKEALKRDKLMLSEVALRCSIGFGEKADKLLGEATLRQELTRCKGLFDASPEVESLIDCRPLNQHLRDEKIPPSSSDASLTGSYVKRSSLSMERSDNLPPWAQQKHGHHFYPFQSDHTKLVIDRIVAKQNLTRSRLGFGAMSHEFGFFVVSDIQAPAELQITCTANVFFVANETEPADDDLSIYPKAMLEIGRLLHQVEENGGLLSIQDASCTPSIQIGSLDIDLNLIYRKQFPFISYKHSIKVEPFERLWNSAGSIEQVWHDSNQEAYNTSIDFQSLSSVINFLNFKLIREVYTNDSNSGSDFMLFLPDNILSLMSKFKWSLDSVTGDVHIYPLKSISDLIDGKASDLDDPNMLLTYADESSSDYIKLNLGIKRKILVSLLGKLGASYRGKTPEMHRKYKLNFESLPIELQHMLTELVDNVITRDEL